MFDCKNSATRLFTFLLFFSSGYTCVSRSKNVLKKDLDTPKNKLSINRLIKNENVFKEDLSDLKSISQKSIADVKQNQHGKSMDSLVNAQGNNNTDHVINKNNRYHADANSPVGLVNQTDHGKSHADANITSVDPSNPESHLYLRRRVPSPSQIPIIKDLCSTKRTRTSSTIGDNSSVSNTKGPRTKNSTVSLSRPESKCKVQPQGSDIDEQDEGGYNKVIVPTQGASRLHSNDGSQGCSKEHSKHRLRSLSKHRNSKAD